MGLMPESVRTRRHPRKFRPAPPPGDGPPDRPGFGRDAMVHPDESTDGAALERTMTYKRRNKLPKPTLQLKVVAAFLLVGALCTVFQYVILHRALGELLEAFPGIRATFLPQTQEILARSLFHTLALFLPLTLGVGILVTFRIAGPLKRLEIHLKQVIDGTASGPCRVRRNDELQDLAALLNQALTANARDARDRVLEEQARRRRVTAVAASAAHAAEDAAESSGADDERESEFVS